MNLCSFSYESLNIVQNFLLLIIWVTATALGVLCIFRILQLELNTRKYM